MKAASTYCRPDTLILTKTPLSADMLVLCIYADIVQTNIRVNNRVSFQNLKYMSTSWTSIHIYRNPEILNSSKGRQQNYGTSHMY